MHSIGQARSAGQYQVAFFNERLKALEDKLDKDRKKDSHNSSKPPSSDPFRKTKSLKKKSDKATGDQKGHIPVRRSCQLSETTA